MAIKTLCRPLEGAFAVGQERADDDQWLSQSFRMPLDATIYCDVGSEPSTVRRNGGWPCIVGHSSRSWATIRQFLRREQRFSSALSRLNIRIDGGPGGCGREGRRKVYGNIH